MEFYKGSTLNIKFETSVPESGTRNTITGYTIRVEAQQYQATVTPIDAYSFKAEFSGTTTEKFAPGKVDIVLYLTKDGRTAVGKATGLVVVDPLVKGVVIPGVTDPVSVSVEISQQEFNFDVTLNNVFAYEDLTEEQKQDIISGIQTEADGLFNQLSLAIASANQATNNAIEATESISETEQIVMASEALRVEAESARVDAETARVSAENTRGTAETARNTAEQNRATAETARVEAEGDTTKGRVKAENDRVAAEALRQQQEAARVLAEQGRAGQINALKLADTKQQDSIQQIENTLNAININQEATATKEDYGILALPKNAANGGMSVKLEGLTAENILKHTNFANSVNSLGVVFTNNHDGSFTANGASTAGTPEFRETVSSTVIGGHKYYFSGSSINGSSVLTVSSYDSAIWGGGTSVAPRIVTALNSGEPLTGFRVSASANSVYNNVTIWPVVIDLTSTFGAGNEPDLATCDKIFANYFDGIKHFVAQGRLRSVGKNILNISPTNKKIYNGQVDGMTTIQRLLYYDILMPITRTAVISGTITNYSIFSSKVEVTSNNANYGIGFKIKAKAGDTYNSSTTPTNGYIGIGIYNNIGTLLANYIISTGGTFTCPADTYFILIVFTPSTAGTNATFVNTQLSKGLVVNTYEPYTESALYLNSPALRSNGTTKDEIRKGVNGYELVQRISRVDNSILATPVVTPIAYGGLLNSNSNGTVYREKVIADAGVYSDKLTIQLTDYPISSFETIIKRSNGVETILNNATAVIASGGLSFTHPDLQSGDLVLFTYYFANESTEGKTTLTYYDSRYVIADTANGKFYRSSIRSTNGVASIILTEV